MHPLLSARPQVLAKQRGIELITLPPAPPAPPARIDLSHMTTVADPPTRARQPSKPRAKPAADAPAAAPAAADAEAAESGPSFFMTEGGVGDDYRGSGLSTGEEAEQRAVADARATALEHDFWAGTDELYGASIDIQTAVGALKAAISRPPARPINSNAHHLRLTASLHSRRREKFAPGGASAPPRSQKTVNGLLAPQRAGGAIEGMAAGVSDLQQRMGANLASGADGRPVGAPPKSSDPEGDVYVASLQSMLHAMEGMSVGAGAGAGAPPSKPSPA